MLLLPDPFGPTTQLNFSPNTNSVRFANDLKPCMTNLLILVISTPSDAFLFKGDYSIPCCSLSPRDALFFSHPLFKGVGDGVGDGVAPLYRIFSSKSLYRLKR